MYSSSLQGTSIDTAGFMWKRDLEQVVFNLP